MGRKSRRRPVRAIRTCRGRHLPVAAPGTLVLPPLQGTSRKVYDKEPEQGDDGEPHDDHQELPDFRRQNLPLHPTSNRTRCVQSIVHQRRIRRERITPGQRYSAGTQILRPGGVSRFCCAEVRLSAPRRVDRRPWVSLSSPFGGGDAIRSARVCAVCGHSGCASQETRLQWPVVVRSGGISAHRVCARLPRRPRAASTPILLFGAALRSHPLKQ
jgi:hypothetical protein